MTAHITLANFTDQGARNIKDSPQRFEAFKSMAEGVGITIKKAHWTTGAYDMVPVTEGPEEPLLALTMKVAALGNGRTQTLRAYTPAEMRKTDETLKRALARAVHSGWAVRRP